MTRIFVIFLMIFSISYAGNVRLKEPPKELSKYYPPNAEGYPFVTLMHTLSISFTGVVTNVQEKDWKNAEKWALKLKDNYLKIGKIVKKWDKLLKKDAVNSLVVAVKEKNASKFRENAQIVGKSCIRCHKSYKISTKILYRYPSFETVSVEDPVSGLDLDYHDYMKKMTDDMKKLKIYLSDGKNKKALRSGVNFIKRFEALQQSCNDCHSNKNSEEIYYGKETKEKVKFLRKALKEMNKKEIQKSLRWIGVNNCMKCHNVHQIQAEIQERFGKK
ncbi:hypothetical protein [Persephonella sp.]